MAISFNSATGNLFNRLGSVGALIANVRTHQLIQLTAMTNTTTGVVAEYNSESDIQAIMGSSYISILQSIGSTVSSTCQQIAEQTVNRMVFRDFARLNQNLTQTNTLGSLVEIIRQMQAAGATVLAMTIGASSTTFTGDGNGVVNVSTKRPYDGLVLENAFAETITYTCSADSYSGGATEGAEVFSVNGQGSQSDLFAFDWPLGSNAQTTLTAIDGDSDNTNGNLLTNSGFASWTGNTPDYFTIEVGTAGTNVVKEASIVYSGSYSMALPGDGTTQVDIQQVFDDSTGTLGTLSPQTQYSFNIFLRRGGTEIGSGVLQVALVDADGDILQDVAGVNNSFNIDLTNLNTVFTAYTGVFRTGQILPDTVYLRLLQTTPIQSSRTVYAGKMSLGIMSQFYTCGPFLAIHSGSDPFLFGDYAYTTITNSRGSGGTLNTWQTLAARLFPSYMYGSELLLPSSASPTISDNLIQ